MYIPTNGVYRPAGVCTYLVMVHTGLLVYVRTYQWCIQARCCMYIDMSLLPTNGVFRPAGGSRPLILHAAERQEQEQLHGQLLYESRAIPIHGNLQYWLLVLAHAVSTDGGVSGDVFLMHFM